MSADRENGAGQHARLEFVRDSLIGGDVLGVLDPNQHGEGPRADIGLRDDGVDLAQERFATGGVDLDPDIGPDFEIGDRVFVDVDADVDRVEFDHLNHGFPIADPVPDLGELGGDIAGEIRLDGVFLHAVFEEVDLFLLRGDLGLELADLLFAGAFKDESSGRLRFFQHRSCLVGAGAGTVERLFGRAPFLEQHLLTLEVEAGVVGTGLGGGEPGVGLIFFNGKALDRLFEFFLAVPEFGPGVGQLDGDGAREHLGEGVSLGDVVALVVEELDDAAGDGAPDDGPAGRSDRADKGLTGRNLAL